MDIINDRIIDFKGLEQEVFNYVCKLGVDLIKTALSATHKHLANSRNKEEYRHKGLKRNTIKTVMGPVEYWRAIYERMDDKGNKQYIYLLDEYLEMGTIGKM